jgi:hypothetical protein
MSDSSPEYFSKTHLKELRGMWSSPDRDRGYTWDFDGVSPDPEGWTSYSYEMIDGLSEFGCKTFDQLVDRLGNYLGRNPNVIDLMGGAYFLNFPEKTNTLTGIRIHNKDEDFIEAATDTSRVETKLIDKITKAQNRVIVEADILSSAGWKKIKEQNLEPADLLVCRPVGPFDNKRASVSRFDNPETYSGLYTSLFYRMTALVNKEDGVIFTEIPDIFEDADIKSFFDEVEVRERCKVSLFTVLDENYRWGGIKRRYAVVRFGMGNDTSI